MTRSFVPTWAEPLVDPNICARTGQMLERLETIARGLHGCVDIDRLAALRAELAEVAAEFWTLKTVTDRICVDALAGLDAGLVGSLEDGLGELIHKVNGIWAVAEELDDLGALV